MEPGERGGLGAEALRGSTEMMEPSKLLLTRSNSFKGMLAEPVDDGGADNLSPREQSWFKRRRNTKTETKR